MEKKPELLAEPSALFFVTEHDEPGDPGTRTLATRDHAVIRRWADRRQAEPATGEATESGPATLQVNDGGAGVRFNFPGFARFRPISWDEWLENFDRHALTFVYEELMADGTVSARYRLMRIEPASSKLLPNL
jgi:hypothetical protein